MDWQEVALKIGKNAFESLPVLIWPIGIFITIFYFRKPLLSILEKASGVKIKVPFGDIEFEIPANEKIEQTDTPNSDIDKNDESKTDNIPVHWLVDVIHFIEEGNIKEAENTFNTYRKNERNPSELYKNKSYYLEFMYVDGNQSDFIFQLEKHISEAKNDQEELVAIISYTRALDVTKQYQKAINILFDFIKKSTNEDLIASAITRISECYISNEEPDKAKKLILETIPKFTNEMEISSLYINLSKVESSLGNKTIASLCLDKAVEFNPTDQEILFDSAFQSNENDLAEISICNYSTLIGINKKHASALNNIAVCAENEKLSLISVKYYKESAEQHNSLAMINQGFRLLNAGFSCEAEDIAKKALAQESPHQNVHNLLTSIHEKREKQHSEWIDRQSKASSFQQVTRKFISAYTREPKEKIQNSTWIVNGITTSIIHEKDSKIEIKWHEEIQNSTSKYECYLSGKITNSAFEGEFFKYITPRPESTLLGSKHESILFKAYGFLNEEENALTIFDMKNKKKSGLILKRQDT